MEHARNFLNARIFKIGLRFGTRFYGSADSVARGSLKTLAPSVFRLPVDAYNE